MQRQTSRDAYKSILDELGAKQRAVYNALCLSPMTNAELADYVHSPINCITPRTGELVEMGLVRYGGVKIGSTGRRCIVWAIVKQEANGQLMFA